MKAWACPGSNAAVSRFSLQLRARITGLTGFPLQSLTQETAYINQHPEQSSLPA